MFFFQPQTSFSQVLETPQNTTHEPIADVGACRVGARLYGPLPQWLLDAY